MKVGFIGAGVVGTSLGFLLSKNGANVSGFLSKSFESAQKAAMLTKTRAFRSYDDVLKSSDVIIISTDDSSISDVVNKLIDYKGMIKGKVFAHLSGAVSIDILYPLKCELGHTMVMHPIQTCPSFDAAINLLPKCYFTLEGDEQALVFGKAIVKKISAKFIVINNINKPLYHAACVAVSNYLVALAKFGVELFKESGFPYSEFPDALIPLMEGTLKNLKENGILASLTGPISRGDVNTIKLHLQNIKDKNLIKVYKSLGRVALEIAYSKKIFSEEKRLELEEVLNE